jgi:hypothetical protein
MKIQQTKGELSEHLRNQVDFLRRSAEAFDKGYKTEALRMAVAIRILLHDTDYSKSLLGQLDKKDVLFYDTAHELDPENLVPHTGLVQIALGGKHTGYVAGLDDIPPNRLNRKVPFGSWWNKIVINDKQRNPFTRKEIILYVANQDGGAHIDPSLDEKYVKLSRFNSLGWRKVVRGVDTPFERPDYASIRQITHEVLKTLRDEFPEYFQ